MLEERLYKIIGSVESQKPVDSGPGSILKGADEVNISLTELTILTGAFPDMFPEEVKLFAEALTGELRKVSNTAPSTQERVDTEITADELLEINKNSIRYLNSLNRLLITGDHDQNDPEQLILSFNIPRDKALSFRTDYIEKLAEAHVRGNDSGSIQYLLKTKNNVFHESRGFIENVKSAIISTERVQLKKKMQLLDKLEVFDLPESAVKAGVTLSERGRLKDVMEKLDDAEKIKGNIIYKKDSLPGQNISAAIVPIDKNKFTWKKYAVAASVIGLIAIASLLVYNDKRSPINIAGNDPRPVDTNRNSHSRPEKTNTTLANNLLDTAETILAVRKEEQMGFAAKQEKITVRVYRITEKIPVTPALQKEVDSLNRLNKMYSFEDNNLSFYITSRDLPLVYKIDNRYYLKMTDSLYQFRPTHKLTRLPPVNDKNISDRIDKINYQQDNK